nr:hypothetical protein [Endozoicomonas sp.]
SRINDTIHLLEGLQKAIEKETRELFIGHDQAELGLENDTYEEKTLFRDSSILLSTLQSHIQTLEKMKTTSFE